MKEKKKKRIIAALLLISCIISGFLLAYTSAPSSQSLTSFAKADSLILNDLYKFNVLDNQIRVQTITVDSNLSRKKYTINVPPGFSKTQLHNELNRTFYDYDVRTPADVIFPHKDFRIHLLYDQTVFRSITLTTDPELTLNRNFGSILVAFDKVPADELLDQVISFGEPISIALIVKNPMEANQLKSELQEKYPHVLFWLQDENGNNIPGSISSRMLPKLQHLQDAVPNAGVLSFKNLTNDLVDEYRQMFSKTNLEYIDASNAILLDSDLGRAAFMQELNKFAQQAASFEQPTAIVMGNKESLEWLKNGLSDFKKSGLEIVPPKRQHFN
ncbi:MAG: hypothetical protein U5J95_06350 [Balneolaceae bacterium]|nr:hypothetical protein [Balneolaceae bacterium]